MRFAIATLGCKVNQYDSATIESRLIARGMTRCEFDDVADVYVINTCTVTNRADSESLRIARRARRKNPSARIVMTGCLAQASPDKLAGSAEIDAVVGLARPADLDRAIDGTLDQRVAVTNLRKERAKLDGGAVVLDGQTRAFLKLQEGCDQFCSFCIVPMSRGTSRSLAPRAVLDSIEDLSARGFREVTLSGVHLGGYGSDLDPPVSLADLLEMIAELSPIDRVRISSLDPEELDDRIIRIISASPIFCAHLHLPLQSGDDETLERMRRRYSRADFRDRVDAVLAAMPDAAIGTDLIVGFPGETRAQFESYYSFVESAPLAYFHVFPYSVRAGTTAAKLTGRVTPAEVTARAAAMRQLGERKRREFAARFIGRSLDVLFEERDDSGCYSGYSENYLRVLTRSPADIRNQVVEVEAKSLEGFRLVAEPVRPQAGC
jgi:threonylcarbamoyladenosine tRNA methylthiotransferase MtaB